MTAAELMLLLDFYQGTFDPKIALVRHPGAFWNKVLTLQERKLVEVVRVLTPIAPISSAPYVRSEGFEASPDYFWRITEKGTQLVEALLQISRVRL